MNEEKNSHNSFIMATSSFLLLKLSSFDTNKQEYVEFVECTGFYSPTIVTDILVTFCGISKKLPFMYIL